MPEDSRNESTHLQVPEPHFIPGLANLKFASFTARYTGFCPNLSEQIGVSYAWATYAVLSKDPRLGKRLAPIKAPQDKYKAHSSQGQGSGNPSTGIDAFREWYFSIIPAQIPPNRLFGSSTQSPEQITPSRLYWPEHKKVTSGDIPFGVGCIMIGDFIACAGEVQKIMRDFFEYQLMATQKKMTNKIRM
ncbi:hypothetical protein HNY73_016051 [Argiope bruennichi]|uniref:Uncharacterized protein n=1 Tax=Argiope bruennichi TaxID=94029 RepID=A0A8T0EIN4_ARGBR|nr:hypothetical protein HNY73_016051 [Argiope bruennichi]